MSRSRENTKLLAELGGILAVITAIVIWQKHDLIVRPWIIGAVAVPWLGLGMTLRANQRTIGFEGKVLDWWSIVHFTAGVLFGLFGIPLAYVLAVAIVWEVIEIYARTREYPTNRVADIVLAAAGWMLANLLASGPFDLL